MIKNCSECKRFTPGSYGDSQCPFTKYNSYFSDFRQVFPHADRWSIYQDSCTRFEQRITKIKKRKLRHRLKNKSPIEENSSPVLPVLEQDVDRVETGTYRRFNNN